MAKVEGPYNFNPVSVEVNRKYLWAIQPRVCEAVQSSVPGGNYNSLANVIGNTWGDGALVLCMVTTKGVCP